jgi:cytoskeletal protein CcmA (bactofilin family)
MFNKTKPTPAPAVTSLTAAPPPAPKPAPKAVAKNSGVPSIISAEMTIHGDLKSPGDLQIEGTIVGEIEVGKLVIAEGGRVEGNIIAQNVRICGALNGSVRAGMVTLTATARVIGDIHHELLAIETGGQLEGLARRLVPEVAAAAPLPHIMEHSEASDYEMASTPEHSEFN